MKKCFATLLALLMVPVLVIGLSACAPQFEFVQGEDSVQVGQYPNAEKYEKGSFSYQADEVEHVHIQWYSGRVDLTQSADETLSVTEQGQGLDEEMQVHWLIEDGTLYIQYWQSGLRRKDVPDEKHIQVQIPSSASLVVRSLAADVCAESMTGDIKSASVQSESGGVHIGTLSAQNAVLTSSSGNIKVTDATVEKKLTVSSMSGQVDIGTLAAEHVKIDTESGAISLGQAGNVSGKTELGTVSGDVSIALGALPNATVTYNTTAERKPQTDLPYTEKGKKYIFGEGTQKIELHSDSGALTVH